MSGPPSSDPAGDAIGSRPPAPRETGERHPPHRAGVHPPVLQRPGGPRPGRGGEGARGERAGRRGDQHRGSAEGLRRGYHRSGGQRLRGGPREPSGSDREVRHLQDLHVRRSRGVGLVRVPGRGALVALRAVAKPDRRDAHRARGRGHAAGVRRGRRHTKRVHRRARAVGTTVTVRGIFEPLPVRHKEFRKNARREYGKALAVLQAYALVSVDARLIVSHQPSGKHAKRQTVLHTQGDLEGGVLANAATVFGAATAQSLVAVDADLPGGGERALRGYVSKPTAPNAAARAGIGSSSTSTDDPSICRGFPKS